MGLWGALTGKTDAARALYHATSVFIAFSRAFPYRDFFRDFFYGIGFGSAAYCDLMTSEDYHGKNFIKKYLGSITPARAGILMKLIATDFTLGFLSHGNRTRMEGSGITPEMIQEQVAAGLDFTRQDFGLYRKAMESRVVDPSRYNLEWGGAVYNLVLGQAGMPPVDEVLVATQVLGECRATFQDCLDRPRLPVDVRVECPFCGTELLCPDGGETIDFTCRKCHRKIPLLGNVTYHHK